MNYKNYHNMAPIDFTPTSYVTVSQRRRVFSVNCVLDNGQSFKNLAPFFHFYINAAAFTSTKHLYFNFKPAVPPHLFTMKNEEMDCSRNCYQHFRIYIKIFFIIK